MKRILTSFAAGIVAMSFMGGGVAMASDSRDPTSAPDPAAAALVAAVPTLETDETPLADIGDAAFCVAGTRTRHGVVHYKDPLGNPIFDWHHDVTWTWNCTKITSITHTSWVYIYPNYQYAYRFGGYLANTISGTGSASGQAVAQGRVGICIGIVVEGCLLERDPGIAWTVNARGGAKAYPMDG